MPRIETREYDRQQSVVFRKTAERYGGLSNMAPGFPLEVNGIHIRTSEALYQACRFPHRPDVQRLIIDEGSPMAAKMRSKPFRDQTRSDWDAVRVKVMRWCLRVKLGQNWETFGALLTATGDQPIVEESRKDDFWGAYPLDEGGLAGANVLGRLLMELRKEFLGPNSDALRSVEPLAIPDFLLYGEAIRKIIADAPKAAPQKVTTAARERRRTTAVATPMPLLEVSAHERDADIHSHSDDVVTRYLTTHEIEELKSCDVVLSRTGVVFCTPLDESQLRTVWRAISAMSRRRPQSEDWNNWLIADWANETDRRLAAGAAQRILREEEEAHRYTQHQLRLAGATLIALQMTELAIGVCVRLLEPERVTFTTEDLLSMEPGKRQRTLGQLNGLLKERKVFVNEFEERLDRFVRHRNKFAHRLWIEHVPKGAADHTLLMESLHELESFMLTLLRETDEIGQVFKGLFAAIGVTLAERENVDNFDRWLDDWRGDLSKFVEVQR